MVIMSGMGLTAEEALAARLKAAGINYTPGKTYVPEAKRSAVNAAASGAPLPSGDEESFLSRNWKLIAAGVVGVGGFLWWRSR